MRLRSHPALALLLLTGLNFLNYIDRSVLPAVQPLIQKELHRSDADMGWLASVFFFFYMCTAPFMGALADRYSRRIIVTLGAMVWSGATLLTAITYDYTSLLVRHTIVGIGEASFVTIAPALIADFYPEHRRGRMLAIFYLGLPVGTALGYLLGGYLGSRHGWRAPFLIAAAPGFLLALLLLILPEPPRGSSDSLAPTPERATFRGLFRNPGYWSGSLAMAMLTFALGGLSNWMPTFLFRVRGMPLEKANLFFGGILAFDGIVATLAGGWLGDYLLRRNKGAYYQVSGAGLLAALPLMVLAIYGGSWWMLLALWSATFFLLLNTSPLNAAIINSVAGPIRSTAIAVNLFVIHILGDVPSPPLMGYISDRTSSLQTAFVPAMIAVAIAAAICFYGMRFAPEIPAVRSSAQAHRA
jgi:predicted MFS family arabinose efflux permease